MRDMSNEAAIRARQTARAEGVKLHVRSQTTRAHQMTNNSTML